MVHLDTVLTDCVAEELHSGAMKLAFLKLEVLVEMTELLKDLLNVVAMVAQVPGVDEDVVDMDYQKHLVHEFLEDRGGVTVQGGEP